MILSTVVVKDISLPKILIEPQTKMLLQMHLLIIYGRKMTDIFIYQNNIRQINDKMEKYLASTNESIMIEENSRKNNFDWVRTGTRVQAVKFHN